MQREPAASSRHFAFDAARVRTRFPAMRFLPLILAAILVAPLAPQPAFAQAKDTEAAAPKAGEETGIDSLFETLRKETRAVAARRVAEQIARKWNESGSATIDLLMGWAGQSMRSEKNALALDLLTQVVILEPGYAEGWNRRATLYYANGDLGRSLADIERTLEIEPRHFGALSGLAAILQKTGQKKKALEVWNRVLAVYPANEQAQKAVIELEDELAGQAT